MDDNDREWVRWEDSGLDRFLPKDEMEALIERRELSDQLFRQSGDQLLVYKTVYLVDATALVISNGRGYPWKDVCLLEGQPIWKAIATVKDALNYGDSGFSDF